jgi:hypothetical protein
LPHYDADKPIALLACGICLNNGSAINKRVADRRLRVLLVDADWKLALEIEHWQDR